MQPLAISVDGHHCHRGWADSLGGVKFPLLADFHPKGAVGSAYGVYSERGGTDSRSTVFVDMGGTVRLATLADGERDMDALRETAEQLAAAWEGAEPTQRTLAGIPEGTRLFVKNDCAPSRVAAAARKNLHLETRIPLVNVSEEPGALDELERLSGGRTAPCLVIDGAPVLDAQEIAKELVLRVTGWW